jgi:hypothetical protein
VLRQEHEKRLSEAEVSPGVVCQEGDLRSVGCDVHAFRAPDPVCMQARNNSLAREFQALQVHSRALQQRIVELEEHKTALDGTQIYTPLCVLTRR